MHKYEMAHMTITPFKHTVVFMAQLNDFTIDSFLSHFLFPCRLQEMEILYKKEKEEADLLLEQQRLVGILIDLFGKGRLAVTPPCATDEHAPNAYPALADPIHHSLISFMESKLTSPGSLSLKDCPERCYSVPFMSYNQIFTSIKTKCFLRKEWEFFWQPLPLGSGVEYTSVVVLLITYYSEY